MRITFLVLVALTLATMAVFALWPQIDLYVANAFYGASGFVGDGRFERIARDFFNVTPFVVLAAFALLYVLRRVGVPVFYAPSGRALVFLAATMVIGPGLVVNRGLKNHSHRPRPSHTIGFGGAGEFRPWYRFDGGCGTNCSFASGEASEAFWMVAPASLAPPPFRVLAVSAALAFGALTSLLRMWVGGHYLSDVLLAGLFTLLIVQGARMLLFADRKPP